MSTLPYDPSVIFSAGLPIDVNSLNKLQSNIASVKTDSEKGIQSATLNIEGVQRNVKVSPVVFASSVMLKITNNRGFQAIDFSGSNFTATPILVASVETNTNPADLVTLRATARSKTDGVIEVFTASASKLTEIRVNFIAVQMQPLE